MPTQNTRLTLWIIVTLFLLVSANKVLALTDEVRSMCQEAEQLINSRNFPKAIKILKRAQKLEPNCGEVHGYLGMAYQNSLKTQKAIPEYKLALKLNPAMSFINVNLGTCYMNLNQPNQAVPYFKAYLRDNPNAPNRAQIEGYINQSGQRVEQNSLRSTFEKGQSLLSRGKAQEAFSIFKNITSANPNFAPGHFFLGYSAAKLGNHNLAIQAFQKSLSLDPSQKEALINIGSNYQSLGNISQAIQWYERYLQEYPNSRKAGDIQRRIKGLRDQAKQNRQTNQNQKQLAFNQQQNFPPRNFPRQNIQQQYFQQANIPPKNNYQQNNWQDNYLQNAASNGRFFRWPANRMPIRVFIGQGNNLKGYSPKFINILKEAFSKWQRASQGRLAFQIVPHANQAQIVCLWTDNPNKIMEKGKSIEGGLTKLNATLNKSNNNVFITKAKLTILTRARNNSEIAMEDDDMMKVCLHEVGHALGINGHSNNNKDIMFYSESPSIWPALTKRDKATIQRLYQGYPIISSN